jgi:hypothetical protein
MRGAARSASARIGALARRGVSTQEQADSARTMLAQAVPAGLHLGRQKCGWLQPLPCLANAARATVEDGYAEVVAALSANPQGNCSGRAGGSGGHGDRRLAGHDRCPVSEAMRVAAHEYAGPVFPGRRLARWFGWFLLALVVVKSYLYVLALEVFHFDSDWRSASMRSRRAGSLPGRSAPDQSIHLSRTRW